MTSHIKGRHAATKTRLKAPGTLSDGARSIFERTVKAVDPDHFSAVDLPLLAEYANAAAQAEEAAQELAKTGLVIDGKPSPWLIAQEKSVRAMVALSARLRVAPQSRFDRLTAGANSRKQILPADFHDPDGLLA